MNIRRFTIASIAVFIAIQVTDPIIHGVILGKVYETHKHLWRPDMMSKMWIMMVSSFLFSFLFIYVFTKGYERKGIFEGIRFGILTGFFVYIYSVINQYVVYPLPLHLVLKWCIFGIIQFTIFGILAALVYKPRSNA
ncbi:MAG: hypothetical protein SV375_14125 [Thermodesulfobacteriota bacterium]|nr:hypothetical protein [Thermodesulfobacteriota bacterium]